MTIDTTGKWWVGDRAEDIDAYLKAYKAGGYALTEFRQSVCKRGSKEFLLSADEGEGTALRVCARCQAQHFICDSQEYWEEAEPQVWSCVECGGTKCNIGVGFSIYDDGSAIRWLSVGVRCAQCGVLGCFADWKIAYTPSLQLMDQA